MKQEEMACRNCGATGSVEIIPKLKHINRLALLAGGIIFSLLFSGSRKTAFRCTACDSRFSQRTRKGWACLIFFWIGIALIVIGFLTFEPE